MPYISQGARKQFDKHIDKLVFKLSLIDDYAVDGCANYIISRIAAGAFEPAAVEATGWRYRNASRAYGTLLAAAAEFYRRVLDPVERSAIERNGDIPEYQI